MTIDMSSLNNDNMLEDTLLVEGDTDSELSDIDHDVQLRRRLLELGQDNTLLDEECEIIVLPQTRTRHVQAADTTDRE